MFLLYFKTAGQKGWDNRPFCPVVFGMGNI